MLSYSKQNRVKFFRTNTKAITNEKYSNVSRTYVYSNLENFISSCH